METKMLVDFLEKNRMRIQISSVINIRVIYLPIFNHSLLYYSGKNYRYEHVYKSAINDYLSENFRNARISDQHPIIWDGRII